MLAASIASSVEGALNALIGTISLVVADLAAVIALSGHAIALWLLRTLSSEVTGLVAAACHVSMWRVA